jgi:hypothetical protein
MKVEIYNFQMSIRLSAPPSFSKMGRGKKDIFPLESQRRENYEFRCYMHGFEDNLYNFIYIKFQRFLGRFNAGIQFYLKGFAKESVFEGRKIKCIDLHVYILQ